MILKPPGLDFKASRPPFFPFPALTVPWDDRRTCQGLSSNLWDRSLAWGSFLFYSCFPQKPCQSVGGGGVPPWGPSIRRPPKVCHSVRDAKLQTPTSNTRHQHRMALLQVSHEIFVFPLPIIPPQARPVHRKPDAKKRKSLVFSHFWSIFSPSETRFKNHVEKTSKKMRKSKILTSPNPPKTLPKSFQNRCSKKHTFFQSFLTTFSNF